MTSVHVIDNKVSTVRKYLALLEGYNSYSQEEIERDPTLRGAVERYLYLVTQASIDVAESTIAFKGFRKPTTNRECFELPREAKSLISSDRRI